MKIDTGKIKKIIMDFHTLTGFGVAIIDCNHNELVNTGTSSPVCRSFKSHETGKMKCQECDSTALENLMRQQAPYYIYECHAGLMEIAAKLQHNETLYGYIIIGQAVNEDSFDYKDNKFIHFKSDITDDDCCNIAVCNQTKLIAGLNLINNIINFSKLKEFLVTDSDCSFSLINEYITSNLSMDLNAQTISEVLSLSRNNLYSSVKSHTGLSLGRYILKLRVEYAADLLLNTNYTIAEVAESCGIGDFNYFSRLFKKSHGLSPRKYRSANVPVNEQPTTTKL